MVELFEQDIRTNDRQSSKGNQLKWENHYIWYKADYTGYEGLSEYVISHLLELTSLEKDEFALCPIFDNGAGLLADITMDYPMDGDIYEMIGEVKGKTEVIGKKINALLDSLTSNSIHEIHYDSGRRHGR